jgi:hypothetical protein
VPYVERSQAAGRRHRACRRRSSRTPRRPRGQPRRPTSTPPPAWAAGPITPSRRSGWPSKTHPRRR